MMFKKICTIKHLSLFFQIAVLMNIIGFLCDLIIYHYFSTNSLLKILTENLNNLSIFMICLVIVSQLLSIFTKRHEELINHYKLLTITIESCLAIFFIWLITIEDDIYGKIIIFSSSLSKSDHSYRLILTLAIILTVLLIELYRTITNPDIINTKNVLYMIRSTFKLVIRKHLLLFIAIIGIFKWKVLKKFAIALLGYSTSSLFFDLSLLEFILPIAWLITIFYACKQLKNSNAHTQ